MARFAQVRQGINPQTAHAIVVEILDDADGPLTDRFHAAFVAALVPESPGMLLGGTWDGADFGPVPRPPSPPTTDEIYDGVIKNEKVLKALVLALNDGSIVPGANATNAALKAAIKAKM
tara:strand:+ start:82 stop:438 length:357 start_codon:yes stop_codon:yes gene_type:complete